MYDVKHPSKLCSEYHIGESGRYVAERVKDHNRRNYKLHILKHSLENGYEHATSSNFSMIFKNFSGNQKRKTEQLSQTLNNHNKPVLLKLFNELRSFEICYWVLAIRF